MTVNQLLYTKEEFARWGNEIYEVRIFSILQLNGERSPYVDPVIQDLSRKGFNVQLQSVAYEF